VRQVGILERAHDVEQRVDVLEVGQERLAAGRVPFLDADDVEVLDLRVGRLLGLERGGEPVEPLVGDLRDADVGLGLPGGVRVRRDR
jgi:hypothetical protein